MRAMVLAAGKGMRLFPLTGEIPRPVAPVVDTPVIRHIFDLPARHGTTEARVNTHHLADALLGGPREKRSLRRIEVRPSLVRLMHLQYS